MKREQSHLLLFALLILIMFMSSCAEPQSVTQCVEGEKSGFWNGLWHGIIAPISFVISLFSDNITMYDVNNNGKWYDFGFVVGAGILWGGGSKARSRK